MPTDSRCEELIRIGDGLFSKSGPWFMLAQEICENFYPIRASYTSFSDPSTEFADYIMDGFPILMREQLGNYINATLRQGEWFGVGSGIESRDKKPENSRALRYATQLMRQTIYARGSNFTPTTLEADQDWVSVGQPVMSIQESKDRSRFVFSAHHPRTCAWLADELGRPKAMWRKFRQSCRNMENDHQTGRYNAAISPEVTRCAKDEPGKEFNIYHVLIPTADLYAADYLKQRKVGMPYVSLYIDVDHKIIMHEGTMYAFNYIAPRARSLTGMPRGFSPMTLNALADARMLQAMALVILEQGEKAVDPPIVAKGEIFTRDMNLFAGGTTFVDLNDNEKINDVMTTVETGEGLRMGVDLKQDVRNLIAESLLINKLTLPSGPKDMRELEVMVRTEEWRRAALPFFSPIEEEYHSQLLGLLFEMMLYRGSIPRDIFPRELMNNEVQFTFNTPLNEAEGRKAVEGLLTGLQITAAAKEVDQTVGNLWNVRSATVKALQGAGIDPEDIKTDREREEADAQAEQEKNFAQGAAIAQQGAGVVADLANARLATAQAEQVA